MEFSRWNAHLYDKHVIEAVGANSEGCYALFRADGPWIFVGKGMIRTKLLAHLGGDNPCITGQLPTHWTAVETGDMDRVQRRLIQELHPVCKASGR